MEEPKYCKKDWDNDDPNVDCDLSCMPTTMTGEDGEALQDLCTFSADRLLEVVYEGNQPKKYGN